jgi:hypothetical protein
MIEHLAAYPWSSYQGNPGDKNITLLIPHTVYLTLGNAKAKDPSHPHKAVIEDPKCLAHQKSNNFISIFQRT